MRTGILKVGLASLIGAATVVGIDRLPKLENQPEDEIVLSQTSTQVVYQPISQVKVKEKEDTNKVRNPYLKIDVYVLQYLVGSGSENGVYRFIGKINNGEDISPYFKDNPQSDGLARAIIIRRLIKESSTSIYESMFPGIELTNWWYDRSELGKAEVILNLAKGNPEAVYRKQPLSR